MTNDTVKPCVKCGATERYKKSGDCAVCNRDRSRIYRELNKEKVSAYGRKWRETNPDYYRKMREANREIILRANRKLRAADYMREYNRKAKR